MEDRYVMLVDENGQPFICHEGMFQKAGNAIRSAGQKVRSNVKYVAREVRPNGKYDYWYSWEEYRKHLQNASRNAGQAAKNVAETAKNTANNAVNKAGQTAKNAVNAAKNAANKAVDVVKDKAGVDERKRAEEAWDKVPRRVSSDDKEAVEAFRKAMEAQKEYRKTPLGAAEYAKERAYEIATGQDGTAKEIAEKAVSSAKSQYERMREDFRKKKNDIADKLGVDERQRLEEAKDYRDRTMNLGRSDNVIARKKDGAIDFSANSKQQEKAQKEVEDRRKEYYDTPLGKIPAVADKVTKRVNETKEAISGKMKDAKDSWEKALDKVEREIDYAGAPKAFRKHIKENAKNLGISEEEAKERLIEWTTDYYTKNGDIERRDRYLEAIRKA